MKQVILLFLVIFVTFVVPSAILAGKTPTFTLLEERLDNDFQPPKVSISFPDGYADTLVLNHFFTEKEKIERCNYIGNLANEPDACVAMTGCIGSDDVEFTIFSNHASEFNMFRWKQDGTVENIENTRGTAYEDDIGLNDEEIADPILQAKEMLIEQSLTESSDKPPEYQKLQIRVVYDDSIRNKLGGDSNVISMFDAVHVHIQAGYCHNSLGSKIKIERVGELLYMPQSSNPCHPLTAACQTYGMQPFTLANLGEADLMVYLCHDTTSGDWTRGTAALGSACNKYLQSRKSSINEYQGSKALFGEIIAHEIGHNLGMYHDFDEVHGGTGYKGSGGECEQNHHYMSYGSGRTKWSECSKKDLQAHFINFEKVWCLDTLSSDPCIIEEEEPCFEAGNYDGNAGMDIDIAKISNVEDPASCQEECQKNLECKFWTYNSEFASWRFGRKKCWLQNANAPEKPGTCTTCTRGPRDCPSAAKN